MSVDLSQVAIQATKPKGKPAKMLAEMGIRIIPIEVLKELRKLRLAQHGAAQ